MRTSTTWFRCLQALGTIAWLTAGADATYGNPKAPPPAHACADGMVHVPGASFWMGPDGTSAKDARHRVKVSGFCIDKTEVTVAAWAQCAKQGTCAAAPTTVHVGDNPDQSRFSEFSRLCNGSRGDRGDHPVNCVDWKQAKAYCEWAGKRLPTEVEWEYAARGTDERKFPWGNEAPDATRLDACGGECIAMEKRLTHNDDTKAMYEASDGHDTTAPVGSYPAGASPFGVLDMAGNVAEWTSSPYDSGGQVYRGGGWTETNPDGARATFRFGDDPRYRFPNLGFRCARGD